MRQMILSLTLTPEKEVLWQGRDAMVMPLTPPEQLALGTDPMSNKPQVIFPDMMTPDRHIAISMTLTA